MKKLYTSKPFLKMAGGRDRPGPGPRLGGFLKLA